MNRLSYKTLFIIVILLLIPIVFLLKTKKTNTISAAWFNDSWNYRKDISLSNSGGTLTNEDVLIQMDTAALISAGKMQSDCDDIRITDSDQVTTVSYWIEAGCNTTTTQIWARIPSIPNGGKTIYIYYNNSSATNSEQSWSGNFTLLNASTCPSGWTRDTNFDGRFPYGGISVGTTGGSSSHNHGHVSVTSDIFYPDLGAGDGTGSSPVSYVAQHTHVLGTNINTTSSVLPPYIDTVFCYKSKLDIKSSLIGLFSTIPSNWTRSSAFDTRFPRGALTYGGVGGTNSHNHTFPGGEVSSSAGGSNGFSTANGILPASNGHTHTTNSGTTGNGSHLPPYIDFLFAAINSDGIGASGMISLVSSLPPLGWSRYSALDSIFPRGNTTYGGAGGTATHNHSLTITTGGPSTLSWDYDEFPNSTSSDTHTHTATTVTDNQSNLPPFYTTIFAQRKTPSSIASSPGTESAKPAASTNPTAWFKLDEGVGTTAYDSTSNQGNAVLGTGTSSPTWVDESQCVSGKCLKFDGNDKLSATGTSNNNPTVFTIGAWVRLNQFNPNTGNIGSVIFTNYGGATKGMIFYIYDDGRVGTRTADGVTSYDLKSINAVSLNQWAYITTTYDGTNLKVFLNGKLENSRSAPSLMNNNTAYIGGWVSSAFTNGFIDDFKIYSYVRTSSQILQDYNTGLSGQSTAKGSSVIFGSQGTKSLSDGLVGYWKFDEGVGTSSVDLSGNLNTVTFSAGTSAPGWAAGKFGIGSSFDGVDDTTTTSLAVTNWPSKTFSTWVYLKTNVLWGMVIMDATAFNSATYTGLFQYGGQKIYLSQRTSGSPLTLIQDNYDIPYNQWVHIAGTIDKPSGVMRIYQNGNLVKESKQDMSGVTFPTPASSIQFGGGLGGSTINGLIDETRIYNRALSPNEIKAIFNYAAKPMAYYNFDEGSGTNLFDKSGNGNNSTAFSGSPTWSSGKFGRSLSLNGSTDNITIPLLNPKSITVSAWFKRSSLDASNADTIFGGWNWDPTASLRNGYDLRFYINTSGINWVIETTNGTTVTEKQITSGNITLNVWHYVSATYDSNTGIAKLYIDGVFQSATTADPGYTIVPLTSFSDMRIGYSRVNSGYFNGLIDEVKVYDYARNQEQIIQDMQGDSSSSPRNARPFVYYKLDEGQGSTITNWGIGGTINGTFGSGGSTPTWSSSGKVNKSLSFDGVDDYATFLNLSLPNNPTATISVWMNSNNISLAQTVISQNGPFAIQVSGSKAIGKIYTGAWTSITSNQTLLSNTWYHISLVYDGANMYLYINGKLDIQTSKTGTLAGSTTMYLGYPQAIGYQLPFSGFIDEVKIYNYALSADEVKTDYNQNSTLTFGSSNQTVGATNTNLDYCLPNDTSLCTSPIAQWNFEEGTGTTAFDISGNNYNASLIGSPQSVLGKIGKAISFNGTNKASAADSSNLRLNGSFTIQGWYNKNSFINTYPGILVKGNSATADGYLIFYLSNGVTQFKRNNQTYTLFTNTEIGTWKNFSVTYDATSQTIKGYLNGVLGVTTTAVSFPTNNGSSSLDFGTGDDYANEKLDGIKIYSYARTPAQVAYDYNKGAPIGWWKMDDCQGIQVADWSGNNNHGTLSIGASGSQNSVGTCTIGTSAAWTNGATGKFNSSLNFDGIDDVVSIGTSNTINPSTGSVSVWAKPSSTQNGTNYYIFDHFATNSRVYINTNSSGNNINARLSTGTEICNSTTSANNWHHIVVTWDNTTATCFIDGQNRTTTSTISAMTTNGPTSYIGNFSSVNQGFTGQIDDVRVYNYALNPSQIQSIFSGGGVNFR